MRRKLEQEYLDSIEKVKESMEEVERTAKQLEQSTKKLEKLNQDHNDYERLTM